jgi:hypothetical protein
MFTEPLPSNKRLLQLHYSGFYAQYYYTTEVNTVSSV